MRYVPRPLMIRLSGLFSFFVAPFYAGNNVECPVCGSTFRTFLSYGERPTRKNVLCPKCLSLERHRLMWLFLKERTEFFSAPHRVLHLAPEQCFIKKFKAMANIDYVTADLESPIADLHFDLHDIPLPDNDFDLIMCNQVLEHVADDRRVMRELLRILKPGGMAILQVPLDADLEKTLEDPSITSPADREKCFGQHDHLRLYGMDYPDRLREEGFTVTESDYLNEIPAEKRKRFRLPEKEIIHLALKSAGKNGF